MTPIDAIAERERPPILRAAVGILACRERGAECYESFTLKVLALGLALPIFRLVAQEFRPGFGRVRR